MSLFCYDCKADLFFAGYPEDGYCRSCRNKNRRRPV